MNVSGFEDDVYKPANSLGANLAFVVVDQISLGASANLLLCGYNARMPGESPAQATQRLAKFASWVNMLTMARVLGQPIMATCNSQQEVVSLATP